MAARIERWTAAALMGAVLSACGGGPTGPGDGPPARLEIVDAPSTALAGNVVPTPSVRVLNADGQVLEGVTVQFTVDAGGDLARESAVTDRAGLASPGGWRLGSVVGTQTLTAETGGVSVSQAVTATPRPAAAFRIEIIYQGIQAPTALQRQAIEDAVRRWEELVLGDLPDIQIRETPTVCPALLLFQGRTVDDLLLFITIGPVAPGVIANTDICIRRGNGLPAVASITVNAEVSTATAGLARVVEHEVAHALGIGSAWPSALLRERDGDLRFLGRSAEAAFQLALGPAAGRAGDGVPVEMGGGPAVARLHWRESVLDQELLTPFSESAFSAPVDQPLSAITVSALRDIGYVVDDSRADPFRMTGPSASRPAGDPGRRPGIFEGLATGPTRARRSPLPVHPSGLSGRPDHRHVEAH